MSPGWRSAPILRAASTSITKRHGTATGGNPTGPLGQAQALSQPGTQTAFQPGEAGGEFLGQQVVVEAGADQIGHDRSGQGRGIEVGQGPRMVGVVGPLHHQLQIGQQAFRGESTGFRFHLRQHTQGRQGTGRPGTADPAAQQARSPMQELLQHRVRQEGIGEGPESRGRRLPLGGGHANQRQGEG